MLLIRYRGACALSPSGSDPVRDGIVELRVFVPAIVDFLHVLVRLVFLFALSSLECPHRTRAGFHIGSCFDAATLSS